MSEISFTGRTVIVTGAGRGLGRSHALDLGRRGANVVVNELDPGLAQEVAGQISMIGGHGAACTASVTDLEGCKAIVDTALNEFGSVDVLINNAGQLRTGFFRDHTDADIDISIAVHLRAAFTLTQLVWPIMEEKNYGRIVMTSSGSGMLSHQGLSAYAAVKAGLYGLTKALSFEGAPYGIKTNAILPNALTGYSPVKPPIPGMEVWETDLQVGPDRDGWRWTPETISAIVTYLCSEECEYTGEAFSILYGRYARVFVGVADGWIAPDEGSINAESIAEHIDEIRDIDHHIVPKWLFEEHKMVAEKHEALLTS